MVDIKTYHVGEGGSRRGEVLNKDMQKLKVVVTSIIAFTTLFGMLAEFYPSAELFNAYLERLGQFFIVNSIWQCSADASPEVLAAAGQKKVLCLFL